ncbi:hypothetical protein SAMN05192584_111101 [Streptomyces pini]|uniref:Uncharacterized protein n=1 Tax=Streptomyces pini TaxID=1520580 RepID=A0A1I4E443_9ACTN|nr:hypothetical protein SAMN05192584_111101 [Streptomyces pini]
MDLPGRRVRLSGEPGGGVGRRPELHPYLRRWDHREPAGIHVHHAPPAWVMGEDGVCDLRLSISPLAGPVPSATEGEPAAGARVEAGEKAAAAVCRAHGWNEKSVDRPP